MTRRELDRISEQLGLNCGGKGGTPGPCPTHRVIRTGGSIGEQGKDNVVSDHDDAESAMAKARRMNKLLSPGEKKYYKIKYKVQKIN